MAPLWKRSRKQLETCPFPVDLKKYIKKMFLSSVQVRILHKSSEHPVGIPVHEVSTYGSLPSEMESHAKILLVRSCREDAGLSQDYCSPVATEVNVFALGLGLRC
jgi:hypothetical protein